MGKEQGCGVVTIIGGWWGPKDTVPPAGAGEAGEFHLNGREGANILVEPGRGLCHTLHRGNFCLRNVPPAQHEGKALPGLAIK